jgi:hypothetical protein
MKSRREIIEEELLSIQTLRELAETSEDPEVQEAYKRRFAMSEQEVDAVLDRIEVIHEQLELPGATDSWKMPLHRELAGLWETLEPEWNDRQLVRLGYPELSRRYGKKV